MREDARQALDRRAAAAGSDEGREGRLSRDPAAALLWGPLQARRAWWHCEYVRAQGRRAAAQRYQIRDIDATRVAGTRWVVVVVVVIGQACLLFACF